MKALFTKVQTDAKTLVSQAKSDFPSQTSAIKSSVDEFAFALKALPANPSASRIGTLAPSAGFVVGWIRSFVNATNSKCS